jgi:hypothetical protein
MGAIGEMFSGAKGIMGWLADCAREVASYSQPAHSREGEGAGEDGGRRESASARRRRQRAERPADNMGRPVKGVALSGAARGAGATPRAAGTASVSRRVLRQ